MRKRLVALLSPLVLLVACEGTDPGETTGTSQTTEATGSRPVRASPVPLVLAGPDGVAVTDADGEATQVSTDPAAAAYGISSELVVFQGARTGGALYPPPAGGPVRVWSEGRIRDLAADPGAAGVELLDARVVEDRPVALVAERFGGIGPDDTFEELVRVDLGDDSRTTIVRRPAWESAHSAGRLLPDGDAIGLFSAEARLLVGRWTPGRDDPLWSVEVGVATHLDLTMGDGTIATVETGFDDDREFMPRVTVTTHDPATGAPATPRRVDIDDPDGQIGTGLFCRDWLDATQLACGRSGGVPVAVSTTDGVFNLLPGGPGAIPTVPHSN